MARRAKIGWWESRSAYGIVIKGKQHILAVGQKDEPDGPTFRAAAKAYSELICFGASTHSGDANTVRVLCERYAQWLEANREPATLKRFLREAQFFVAQYGERACGEIKPLHLDDYAVWLKTKRKWQNTRFPLQVIKNAWVWGVKKKLIVNNPFDGVTLQDYRQDTDGRVIPKDEAENLIAVASPYFAPLLRFLWATGARPEEAYHLTAKHYDKANKCVVHKWTAKKPDYIWKNAKKTKRDRRIYLTDDMIELVEAQIERYPRGPLFPTKFGKRWGRLSASQQMLRVRREHGVGAGVTPYGFRHTYITNFLLAGGSIKVLADLCGTSVEMIEKTYSHISEDMGRMRELMMQTAAPRLEARPKDVTTTSGRT